MCFLIFRLGSLGSYSTPETVSREDEKGVEIVWIGFAANGGSLPFVRAMNPTLPQQKEVFDALTR
jgi:hypothetical protein